MYSKTKQSFWAKTSKEHILLPHSKEKKLTARIKKLDFKKTREKKTKRSFDNQLKILREIIPQIDAKFKSLAPAQLDSQTRKQAHSNPAIDIKANAEFDQEHAKNEQIQRATSSQKHYLTDTIKKLNLYLKKIEVFSADRSDQLPLSKIRFCDFSTRRKVLALADEQSLYISNQLTPRLDFRLLNSYQGESGSAVMAREKKDICGEMQSGRKRVLHGA